MNQVERFVERVKRAGRVNSLAQTLLKLTAPGVPDLYQGTELWDLSLVDPDNRRPVDYEERRRALAEIAAMDHAGALSAMDRGLPKIFLIHRTLAERRSRPELFSRDASYLRLLAEGPHADHVLAFARAEQAVTVVPRFGLARGEIPIDAFLTLPPGRFIDAFTGLEHEGRCPVARLVAGFPVAFLLRQGAS
jgi:(1->4)-alpha-D-glucan 1-alpha-D-glucosylmutase